MLRRMKYGNIVEFVVRKNHYGIIQIVSTAYLYMRNNTAAEQEDTEGGCGISSRRSGGKSNKILLIKLCIMI